MADAKRNSIAGKVATPKTAGAQQPLDTLEAIGKVIGARVKVTTTAPSSIVLEGTLFTACPILNVIAINTRNPPPNPTSSVANQPGDYHLIPISKIHNFQIVSLAAESGFADAQPGIGPVDTKRLKDRLDARVAKLKEEEKSRGKGVTREAQAIFDAFKRINLPVRWHNDSIIVHDAVIVAPPYRPEDCMTSKDKQEALNRVKKVLEGERRKLKEREERERKAQGGAAGGPRKGG